MPALIPRKNLFDDPLLPAQDMRQEPGWEGNSCLCGSRLPLQVRLGLRSRTRPVVDGRWCCSERCLQVRIAAFVRRGVPGHALRREHHHRVPLGLLLLSSHVISQDQLRYAKSLVESTGERLGDVLVRDCGLSEKQLAEGLATQWGCTAWDVRGTLQEGMACVAPYAVLRAAGMLPLREQRGGPISVAFTDALDAQAVFAVRRIHDRPVDAGIAPATDFAAALRRLLRQESVPVEDISCESDAELIRLWTSLVQKQQPVESRWARLHNMFWIRMWLEPAALAGGLAHTEDVVDYIFHMPQHGVRP